MFSLFKKKQQTKQRTAQPSKNEAAICIAVEQLKIQLMLCSSYLSDKKNLEHEFVRGYFVGYLDCALQMIGQPIDDDEEFFLLLRQSHALLLERYIPDIQSYTFASLKMRDIPLFSEGQQAGGDDFYGLHTGKIRNPLTLAMHFNG